mmetsp:Transcript_11358/g.28738  ORF Transcript_11358/g.28738 Transcript_11358/m.28738 type:complete len:172 (+) Transcript_11358:242-757(+)
MSPSWPGQIVAAREREGTVCKKEGKAAHGSQIAFDSRLITKQNPSSLAAPLFAPLLTLFLPPFQRLSKMSFLQQAGKEVAKHSEEIKKRAGEVASSLFSVECYNDSDSTIEFSASGKRATIAPNGKGIISVGGGGHTFRVKVGGADVDATEMTISKKRTVHFDGNKLTKWN